mgnify:CR=1 FL=1
MRTPAQILRSIPIVQQLQQRTNFTSSGGWVLGVNFNDHGARREYARARSWCDRECRHRWRCEPDRLANETAFHFEDAHDATLFGLFFPVLRRA